MTAVVTNNGGGIPDLPGKMDIDVAQDTDDGPFISVSIQDHESGLLLIELILDDEEEAEVFLGDVQSAVKRFKEAKAKA